ncbi:hypothetical protein G9F72_023220 [Clostridium estertheticum]|uniref:hypothetical protein n=1 Tax=Clostridium estertheticum TaxID=238834 RepID=UPI0013E92477|nr:hypothetical protein [Clostridium estertheticum]MBZ9689213.1 hypothetical protein [Clostridium estertheticum]
MNSQKDKKENRVLALALIDVAILSFSHAYDINAITILALVGFALILLFSPSRLFLPIMLFYLPWSPILKISADSFTMFTLFVPLVFLVFMLKNGNKKRIIDTNNIILVLLLTFITLATKLCLGYSISGEYLQFLFMMLFTPLYLRVYVDKIYFPTCIVYFAVGAISASATSQILMNYPNMRSFIDVYEWRAIGLSRLSGFYGDSNFYSVHFLAAISGLLVMISKCKSKLEGVAEILGVFALIYYGMMSVSKMFIICLILIIIVWVCGFLIGKGRFSSKFVIMMGIFAGLLFLFLSNVFIEQINYYLVRFNMTDNTTSSFTTGRSDLWVSYLSYIFNDIWVLLFGIGLTNIRLSVFLNDTHNIVIEMLYQIGIVGSGIIVIWIKKLWNSICIKNKLSFGNRIYQFVMLIGLFLPWMALDMLYFDEFFYILWLYLVFKKYIMESNSEKVSALKIMSDVKSYVNKTVEIQ